MGGADDAETMQGHRLIEELEVALSQAARQMPMANSRARRLSSQNQPRRSRAKMASRLSMPGS